MTPKTLQRQIQRQNDILEKLQNQILQRSSELEGLDNQVRSAQIRRDNIVASLQAEAEKKSLEVRSKLQAEADTLKASIKTLQNEKTQLQDDAAFLKNTIEADEANKEMLEAELSDLIGAIHDKDQELKTVNNDISARSRDYKMVMQEISNRTAEITGLDASIIDIKYEKDAVIAELDTKRQELEEDINSLSAEQAKLAEDVSNLETTLQKRINQLKEVAAKDDAMRKSLADERIRLDRLDKNLRTREAQVRVGESRLQENAELLNL